MIDSKKRNKYLLIAFIASLLPRLVCLLLVSPTRVIMDEVCGINAAAYFAGLDWSNVVVKGSYYGIGFFGLFSFMFKLTDNPFIIYYFILSVLALIQASTSIICFNILEKFYKEKNHKWTCIVSITCSYMVVTRANSFENETILIFLTWVIIYTLLCLTLDLGKMKKAKYTFLLFVLLSYALLCHTRAVTYWISIGVVIVAFYLIFRKHLISYKVAVFVSGILIPLGKFLIKNYQNSIWVSENIANASISIDIKVFSVENIKTWTNIILGEINTIGVYTGGISYVVIVISIFILIKTMRERKEENKENAIIVLFCIVCVAVSIGGMVASWGTAVAKGINNEIVEDYYYYKAFTYIRYFGPYLGPLMLVGIQFVKKNVKLISSFSYIAMGITGLIQLYWIKNIIPYIAKNSTTVPVFMIFTNWREGDEYSQDIYLAGILVTILCLFIFIIFNKLKNRYLYVIGILFVLMSQYIYQFYGMDNVWSNNNYIQVDAGYKIINELEDKINLPTEIYVRDYKAKSHHKTYILYQFMLNQYTIQPIIPKEVDEAILFVNSASNPEFADDTRFKQMKLDDNEYMLVIGEQLIGEIEELGYVFN
ncbi:MAG: hypothetical protein IJ326_03285 [Lachnospiraceae bacterium]|nr:hypothetical protein [Lachnospiraceae bacterium]